MWREIVLPFSSSFRRRCLSSSFLLRCVAVLFAVCWWWCPLFVWRGGSTSFLHWWCRCFLHLLLCCGAFFPLSLAWCWIVLLGSAVFLSAFLGGTAFTLPFGVWVKYIYIYIYIYILIFNMYLHFLILMTTTTTILFAWKAKTTHKVASGETSPHPDRWGRTAPPNGGWGGRPHHTKGRGGRHHQSRSRRQGEAPPHKWSRGPKEGWREAQPKRRRWRKVAPLQRRMGERSTTQKVEVGTAAPKRWRWESQHHSKEGEWQSSAIHRERGFNKIYFQLSFNEIQYSHINLFKQSWFKPIQIHWIYLILCSLNFAEFNLTLLMSYHVSKETMQRKLRCRSHLFLGGIAVSLLLLM